MDVAIPTGMRSVLILLALAACTESGGKLTTCSPLACQGPVCMLATAEQDVSLCPAFEQKCGGQTIIRQQGTDTSTEYYYDSSGKLVAEVFTGIARQSCEGPPLFQALGCDTADAMLAVCGGMP